MQQFEEKWESHREFLRRMLIGLARDIDLADDLLQETYIKARAGMQGFQDGDLRSWLTAIARNAFFSHKRRRYVRYEVLPTEGFDVPTRDPDPLALIEIRQAIASLPQNLRTALVMKHYGGYTYEEISRRMGCPEGTAKSRVNLALKRLRVALSAGGEEQIMMRCAELSDRLLLDYIYDKLSKAKRKAVEEHLLSCERCPGRSKDIGEVLRALDELENEYRLTSIIEIAEGGMSSEYLAFTLPDWPGGKDVVTAPTGVEYVTVNGKEASLEELPEGPPHRIRFQDYIPAGERVDMLWVARVKQDEWVKTLDDGRKRLEGRLHLTEKLVYVMAIRLPAGAEVVTTSPRPSEIRRNCTTTVIWRNIMQPNERTDFVLEYMPGQ